MAGENQVISLAGLKFIMPLGAQAGRVDHYYPFITSALSEFGISSSIPQLEMFLANVAKETGELRWMEEIASGREYEGRRDLGNIRPGDGPRYKGRGGFQLTGRFNYMRYGHILGVDLISHPELAAGAALAFRIAGLYWKECCASIAEQGDFEGVVRAINGGLTGLSERLMYYRRAIKVIGS